MAVLRAQLLPASGAGRQEPRALGRQHRRCWEHTKTFTEQPPKSPSLLLPCFPQSIRLSQAACLPVQAAVSSPPRTYLREDKLNMTPKRTVSAPASLLTLAALDLPVSFQDIFQLSIWRGESPRRAIAHPTLGVGHAGGGRILRKLHSQLCKVLSKNSTMF